MYIQVSIPVSDTMNADDAMALASDVRDLIVEAIDEESSVDTIAAIQSYREYITLDEPVGYAVV